MKKLFSLFLPLLLIVACGEKTTTTSTAYNILDSIPNEKPILEDKYNLNKENFKKKVMKLFGMQVEKQKIFMQLLLCIQTKL